MSGMTSLPILFAALSLSGVASLHAQGFDWSVERSNGEKLTNVALTRITPDSIVLTTEAQYEEWVALDSVVELRRERRSAVLPATLIGAAAGASIGYALKPTAMQQGEANLYSIGFGMVLGGVGGFLIGSNLQPDEVINLRGMGRAERFDSLTQRVQANE